MPVPIRNLMNWLRCPSAICITAFTSRMIFALLLNQLDHVTGCKSHGWSDFSCISSISW